MISKLNHKFVATMMAYLTEQDELVLTILAVLVPILLLVWYTKRGTAPLPPGPYGLPIVGYLPFMGSNWQDKFTEMADKYGPIFSVRMGTKLHVVMNSMEMVRVVARDLDHTFAFRSPPATALALSYGGNDIIWSNHGSHPRKLLINQMMSSTSFEAYKPLRLREVKRAMNHVYTNIGKKIDINELAYKTLESIIANMLWSYDPSSDLLDGFRDADLKIMEILCAPNISDFIPLLSWFDVQGKQREMENKMKYVDKTFDHVINRRIEENKRRKTEGTPGRKDFLQILLELKDQKDSPRPYDNNHIKGILIDLMLAGTDTPALFVEWVMSEILHNPSLKSKVREELTKVVGMKNIVEESHLPNLKYLDAVIKETLRLHPPLPLLIQRSPNESCTVGGYNIPKGSIVYMNLWLIQRDPNNWEDPLVFKPERFLDEKFDYNGKNFKYIPFGSGRRMCPGRSFGEKMLMFTIASLLHSFEWSVPENEDFDLDCEDCLVSKKKNPLQIIASPRLSDATLYEC